MTTGSTWRIAREEWRLMRRDRVAVLGLLLLFILTTAAAFTAWDRRATADAQRSRHQHQMDEAFEAQPDRHPHRMVHYGHFAFRPLEPLAAFDPGTDAFTGHTLFLEGHRQNSANFGEVRQSSLLLRFGQFTPALVMQVLAPLLLIFVGHAVITREREAGTLRVLLAQGLPPGRLVAGKLLAVGGVAAIVTLPALLALGVIAGATSASALLALAMAAGYLAWMLAWAVAIVAVSAWLGRSRDALLVLLAAWALGVVAMPRVAAEIATASRPSLTRAETDLAIQRDLAALGNSHNAGDSRFAAFRRGVLAQYGVERIEDLPVNYKGLVAMEGERQTSELFVQYAAAEFERQQAQLDAVDRFAWLSPVLAIRRGSMAIAGTDLQSYRRFMEQAERHRYEMVQALNRLQAEQLTLKTDRSSRDDRISHVHWQGIAAFRYVAEGPIALLRRAAPAGLVLLAWSALLCGALVLATRRLGRIRQ